MGLAEHWVMDKFCGELHAVRDQVPEQLRTKVAGALVALAASVVDELDQYPLLAGYLLVIGCDLSVDHTHTAMEAKNILEAEGLNPSRIKRLRQLLSNQGEMPDPLLTSAERPL